jgi:ubiquinone biosynthesis protein
MLDPKLIPTPLIERGATPPMRVRPHEKPPQFRLIYVSWHLLGLVVRLSWLRLTRRLTPRDLGRKLAQFLCKMGVLWIKVGQLLSMRPDMLPVEVCDELSRLQDFTEGHSFERVRRVMEEDLGQSLEHFFTDFQETPFASGSVAQVHRARLKEEGIWTAVKVQLPDAGANFRSDMLLVRLLIWLMTWMSIKPYVRWSEMLWEIDHLIREELDFHYEATNMRRMSKILRKHNVYIPMVFEKYSTERVLVMEYVAGVVMSDYIKVLNSEPGRVSAWLRANNIDPRRAARRLFFSALRQALEDNLFHGDLHPGNVVLLRDSQIALLDFGSVGFTERELLRKYDLYMQAMYQGQYMKMADIYLLCVDRLPPRSLSEVKELFSRNMQGWERATQIKDLPYQQKSIGQANDGLIQLMGEYGISPVWGFLRMTRAYYSMDACFRALSPQSNVFKLLGQYYRRKEKRLRKQMALRPRLGAAGIRFLLDAPVIFSESVMFNETIIRRSARVFEGTSSRISVFFGSVLNIGRVCTMLATTWLLAVWGFQHIARFNNKASATWMFSAVPRLDDQVWIVAGIILIYLHRSLSQLKGGLVRVNILESGS